MEFEVQYFENNITIQEVYYSDKYNDNIDNLDSFYQDKIAISIPESGNLKCSINEFRGLNLKYIKNRVSPKRPIFVDLYDCFKHLHPSMYLYHDESIFIPDSLYTIRLYTSLYSFIERFYLYTQLEQINQKIKKYQINMNDLF
jgi:hypothetical protein